MAAAAGASASAKSSARSAMRIATRVTRPPKLLRSGTLIFSLNLLRFPVFLRRGVMRAAGRLEIAIGVTRIVVRVSERVAVIEEEPDGFGRDREAQAFAERDLHVRDANHFAAQVEKRAAAVARVDLGRGLQIEGAPQLPRLRAQDPLGDRAFEPQRAANGEDAFADRQRVGAAQDDV